jgi:hypothetical protein
MTSKLKRAQHKAKLTATGKLNAPTLTGMRATISPRLELNRQLRRNESLRDDDGLIAAAAEAKPARKAAKRASKNLNPYEGSST